MIKNVFYSQTVFEEKSMDLAERHQTNQNDAWFMGISGAWTPPLWMKGFMAGSPLHHDIDIGFSIFLKGSGLTLLWRPILIMALTGSLIFAADMMRFRRQFGS